MSSEEALPKTKDLARAIEQAKAEVRSGHQPWVTWRGMAELLLKNDSILNQLLPFRSKGEAAAKPMSAEETAAIDAEFTKWRKYWVDRRKLYKSSVLSDQCTSPRCLP